MTGERIAAIFAFLTLSLFVHFSLIYLASAPLVATQDNVKLVGHVVQEVSISPSVHLAETVLPGTPFTDNSPLPGRGNDAPAKVTREIQSSGATSVEVSLNQALLENAAIENFAEIVMLPVMQARELLPSEIDLPSFKESERLRPLSFNAGYVDAAGLDKRAKARQNLVPIYPQDAYEANRQGRVVAELLINAEGNLDASLIIAATEGFAASAAEALRGMTFVPAEKEGIKVASRLLVEMDYLMINPSFSRVDSEEVVPVGSFDNQEK